MTYIYIEIEGKLVNHPLITSNNNWTIDHELNEL